MPTFLLTLENTALGTLIRESLYGFQIVVGIHILGLVFSVGTFLWFDLRLLGWTLRSEAVSRVYRQVIPWATGGFLVMFLSGAMLFTGFATKAYGNPYFSIKIAAILLAGANAALYHLVTERGQTEWDAASRPPAAARAAGMISMLLWATVIVCGRLMAYTMYGAS